MDFENPKSTVIPPSPMVLLIYHSEHDKLLVQSQTHKAEYGAMKVTIVPLSDKFPWWTVTVKLKYLQGGTQLGKKNMRWIEQRIATQELTFF